MKIKSILSVPFHPFVLAIYFPLTLFYLNIEEAVFSSTERALLFTSVFAVIVFLLARLFFKEWWKAALLASLIIFLFFTYGHIQNLAQSVTLGSFVFGRHRTMIPLWIALFGLGLLWIKKTRVDSSTSTLNMITLTLVAFTVIQIAIFQIRAGQAFASAPTEEAAAETNGGTAAPHDLPDVYYIILDSYGRQDVMKNDYKLDNSDFIRELENMGLVVPDCTQSNYDHTVYSLTSSLNMAYLEDLGFEVFPEAKFSKTDLHPYLKQSAVRKHFEEMGYATVTFKSVYPQLDITDSTYYYDYFLQSGDARETETLSFYYLFLRTTAFLPLVEYGEVNPALTSNLPAFVSTWLPSGNMLSARNYRQYQQNMYLLDVLKNMPATPGPKFVYAHLFTTHQPFVFTPDGKFRGTGIEDNKAYREQVLYADVIMPEILKAIIENSAIPPIIVVQGDHSYSQRRQRLNIFNAYYLPDGGSELLYPQITPVNTFRVIFNRYFGGNYEILKDISYLSAGRTFDPVGSSCVGGQ
jgi:hypothetical protein